MALTCFGFYFMFAAVLFMLLWRALALAKNDDINSGLDFIENPGVKEN